MLDDGNGSSSDDSGGRASFSNLRLIRRFYAFLAPYRTKGFLALVCMLISVLLQIPIPFLTGYLIDHVASTRNYHVLALIGVALVGTLAIQAFSGFLQSYLLMRFRARVLFDMRVHLYDHLQHLSARFFFSHQTGYLTARIGSDVQLVDGLLADALIAAFQNALLLITGIACTLSIHIKLGLISIGFIPVYGLIVLLFNTSIRSMTWEMRERYANSQRVLQELITGMPVIQGLNAQRAALLRLVHATRKTTQQDVRTSKLGITFALLSSFVTSVAPIVVVLLGVAEIMAGRMTVGKLVAFNAFLRYLFAPTSSLLNGSLNMQKSLAAVERIVELLDTTPEVKDRPRARIPSDVRGRIDFRNVSFAYEAEPVLRNVTLHVEPGEVVAVVGPSGAGKSSLCSLLLRTFDPNEGSILLDGVDITELKLKALRDTVGLVPQDVFLFHDTIRENIILGNRGASEAEFLEACRLASLEFVSGLPKGFDTVIGERGATLSGASASVWLLHARSCASRLCSLWTNRLHNWIRNPRLTFVRRYRP